jgi:hypothetical protein
LARALTPPPVVAAKFEVDVEGKPILPTSRVVDDQSGFDAQANAPNADHGLQQTGTRRRDGGATRDRLRNGAARRSNADWPPDVSAAESQATKLGTTKSETRRLEPPPLRSLINRADIFARKLHAPISSSHAPCHRRFAFGLTRQVECSTLRRCVGIAA